MMVSTLRCRGKVDANVWELGEILFKVVHSMKSYWAAPVS